MTAPTPASVSYTLTRADLVRYADASGDLNPIHLSPSAAEAAGLPGVVVHGMLLMGLALRAVTRWAGDPAHVRNCTARFLQPVTVPEDSPVVIDVEAAPGPATLTGDAVVELRVRCAGRLAARLSAVVRVGFQHGSTTAS
ncbi:MaoC/PaaZ C-terminal domain-containing protein [Microtetraspora malaysiensis]|uniref:MaoC/PaaZ C-terminal domain-containing protein n=1 Tax=Microtetraspora malaysiensis TaxID=161358 RepID=UPI003D93BE1B